MRIIYLVAIIFIFQFYQPVYAYIDPGILTFIWQGLILALTSAYFLFKNVRDKIIDLFLKIKNKFKNEKADKPK